MVASGRYRGSVTSLRGDEGSRTLIDRFTRPTLCYPIELHRHLKFGGLGGIQTLTRSLQDFYAVVTSPARKSICQFPIVDCRLNISVFTVNRQLQIGNELVAEAGVEPAPFRL